MTPMTSARPSLLAAAGILAVAGTLAATRCGQPSRGGARIAPRERPHGTAVHGLRGATARASGGGDRRAAGARAALLDGGPDGPGTATSPVAKDPAIGPAIAVPARRAAGPGAARVQGRPAAAAVLTDTATAGWPGGGAVARDTGKVFFTMNAQDYVCSGAVVASANADVVITAAHCVKNGTGSWAANWTFVPGFTQGSRPYGSWTARHYFVAPTSGATTANDNDDVAFVTLNPQHVGRPCRCTSGRWRRTADHVRSTKTAEEFAFGYPAEPPYNGGGLYYCSGRVTRDAFHASPDSGLRCELTAGSSGGPWLSGFDPVTGTGTITSVSSFKYSTDPSTLYGPPLGAVAQGPVQPGTAQLRVRPRNPRCTAQSHDRQCHDRRSTRQVMTVVL